MKKICKNCNFYEIETYNHDAVYDWCMWYGVHVPTHKYYLCNHWEKNPEKKPKTNINKRIHIRYDEITSEW